MKKMIFTLLVTFLLIVPLMHAQPCSDTLPATFTVHFPVINIPPDEEGQGWVRPDIWDGENAVSDQITVPNGRPIYALIVSGYASNKYLDEMMLYNFARHLMAQGAYVHYSWWNNLLAPYMERPLHHSQSEPGALNASHFANFTTGNAANKKALPGEDYQFVADAKIFIAAIRENNPNAIIIVAGHSMGGGAVVHLGSQTNELIDILAPIDPVGNRNFPFAGVDRLATSDFNWTRWRVSRDNFLGYKKSEWGGLGVGCVPDGDWLASAPLIGSINPLCALIMFVHSAPTLVFGSNIINLHHRYQQEALFPFDYSDQHHFGHTPPPGGTTTQGAVPMTPAFCSPLLRCDDPGGWPALGLFSQSCCETGDGVGWNEDGHGEIVGYRGPGTTVPLGVRFRTSPECGSGCSGLTWPARTLSSGTWGNGNSTLRKQKLMNLEQLPLNQLWSDRPTNPDLCKVSFGLINKFIVMNKPPTANAGVDQIVECTGQNGAVVTLNGSASIDPDGDVLSYLWSGTFGTVSGQSPQLMLPIGTHCITLTVSDPSGHMDLNKVMVEVTDTTPPVITLSLNPNHLWPPNHKLVDIMAVVSATDLCGTVDQLFLYSIVASEDEGVLGSGNTSPDIVGAEYNTLDLLFQLRAERSGKNKIRVYTVTYKAIDNSGNISMKSAEVTVSNPSNKNDPEQNISEREAIDLFYSYPDNFPNPFNPVTTIQYYVPENDHINVSVYNFFGQKVVELVNGSQLKGYKTVVFDGSNLSSGMYFYKISLGQNTSVHKMILIK